MTREPVPADPGALAARLRRAAADTSRLVVGICGAPGAGKSVLAALLVAELSRDAAAEAPTAVVVPMDGFHLAASVIAGDERASRRGAPDTFDADGYASLLHRLRANTEEVVYAPECRRELEDPVAGAIAVPRSCRIVVTEGNYLLHPAPAWTWARAQLDEVWFLEAPSEELRVTRLVERHEHFGKSPEHARRHVLDSDERNARLIASWRERAHLRLRWPQW